MWKVYFELAQAEARAGNVAAMRDAYVKSVSHCPPNLRWKLWLAGKHVIPWYPIKEIA